MAEIKFPPFSEKGGLGRTRYLLPQELAVGLKQASSLEDKVEMFGEFYRHCPRKFWCSERKECRLCAEELVTEAA